MSNSVATLVKGIGGLYRNPTAHDLRHPEVARLIAAGSFCPSSRSGWDGSTAAVIMRFHPNQTRGLVSWMPPNIEELAMQDRHISVKWMSATVLWAAVVALLAASTWTGIDVLWQWGFGTSAAGRQGRQPPNHAEAAPPPTWWDCFLNRDLRP